MDWEPKFDAETMHWQSIPDETTLTDEWTVLVLDNGNKILTFGDKNQAGAQVHVLGAGGKEIAMWDCMEWECDPEEVMGAMLRAAGTKSQ